MNSHDHTWYEPIVTTVCALYVAAPSEVTLFFIFPTLEDVLTQLGLSGLFHVLCLDDTSDIQPVVLVARRSISSQSGGGPFGWVH